MAVRIRLKRMGSKQRPFYRVVVMEQTRPRDGKTLEEIGYYNPKSQPKVVELQQERVHYWLGVGAQPSDTVLRLLADAGLAAHKKLKSGSQGISKKDRKKEES